MGPREEYNLGTIDDSFEGVNKDDPFFGLVRKILQACVNKENIPLEKILVDNGLYKGIWVLLHNYPIITIFGIKKYPLLEEAEDSKEENNDIIRLNKEVEELKVKVENISEKANSIDELKSILVNVLDKLKDLSSSSMAIFSEIDYVETSIYAAGYVAPFLTYKKLLSQYLKLTEINYKPQNAGEVRILHSMKRESIIRFNRVGIPLMALTYLAIWNSSNFKNIFKGFHLDGAFTPVEGTDHILESEITNKSNLPFLGGAALKLKNKIVLIPLIILLIRYIVIPVFSSQFPTFYTYISINIFNICIVFMLLWILFICLYYIFELFIYNLYLKNNNLILPNWIQFILKYWSPDLKKNSKSSLKDYYKQIYLRSLIFHLIILLIIFLVMIYFVIL